MKLLRKAEMLKMVGVSYPTVWQWMKDGKFPEPRVIGKIGTAGAIRWVEAEVEAWIKGLPKREYGSAKSRLIGRA